MAVSIAVSTLTEFSPYRKENTITKIIWLVLLKEIMDAYNTMKPTNTKRRVSDS
jgi:hypothetical protein